MSKILRIAQKQYGVSGLNSEYGQFGSLAAGAKTFTKNPVTMQALSAFEQGWAEAIVGQERPALEDMNSLFYLAFYQICYLLQQGVAEWDEGTTYYIGSIVNVAGVPYVSLADDNLNNAVTDTTKWANLVLAALPSGSLVQEVVTLDNTVKSGTGGWAVDSSAPLWSEGWQYTEIQTKITPTDALNIIEIQFEIQATCNGGNGGGNHAALFKNASGSDPCIYGTFHRQGNQSGDYAMMAPLSGYFRFVAGTTDELTFDIRFSNPSGMNGYTNVDAPTITNTYGGTIYSAMRVREIKA